MIYNLYSADSFQILKQAYRVLQFELKKIISFRICPLKSAQIEIVKMFQGQFSKTSLLLRDPIRRYRATSPTPENSVEDKY